MSKRLENLGGAAAGIAHDINNQLTLIANHIAAGNVQPALEAVAQCAGLTQSLLAYARGEAIELRPIEPAGFLRAFLSRLRLPKGVRLLAEVPPVLPRIAADPFALERALNNLIANACSAMNNDGTVRISASPLTMEISDSGPGISPENGARIFDPFFTTKGERGTGLGLAIVRDIMRQHSGSATLHSQPGCGARFTLQFKGYGMTGFKASPRKIAPAA